MTVPAIRVTDTLSIDEADVVERFVRASGPGGQNVNKVASAVELRFDVRASSLPEKCRID
jgi:ribosome-associated protein